MFKRFEKSCSSDKKRGNVFSRFTSLFSTRAAFSLAEVLITIGIIGVVAAITLPTLMNNVQDNQFKVAWKKEYSTINNAIREVYADEGQGYYRDLTDSNSWKQMPRFYCKVENKLKVLKSGLSCPANPDEIPADETQWPKTGVNYWHMDNMWYKKTGATTQLNIGYNPMSAVLADGAIINFNGGGGTGAEFFVDVNGKKKPNTTGRDIFYFLIKTDGTNKPGFWGLINNVSGLDDSEDIKATNYEEDCKTGSGWGCSPQYILNQ